MQVPERTGSAERGAGMWTAAREELNLRRHINPGEEAQSRRKSQGNGGPVFPRPPLWAQTPLFPFSTRLAKLLPGIDIQTAIHHVT